MKKKWIGLRILFSLCAAIGWWGLLYPELTLTPDTVAVHTEDCETLSSAAPPELPQGSSLYLELLGAGRDKITFRSKLLTDLSNFWENINDRNGKK